eukprot:s2547_g7.t1
MILSSSPFGCSAEIAVRLPNAFCQHRNFIRTQVQKLSDAKLHPGHSNTPIISTLISKLITGLKNGCVCCPPVEKRVSMARSSKGSLLSTVAVVWGFAAAFIGHAGPLRRWDARTSRPASSEGSLDAARAGGKQELFFLDEKDYIRLFRSELEEHAKRALFRRKKRFLPFDDCVKWVRAMGLWDSKKEWEEWIAMGEKRNPYIPTRPDEYYGKLGSQWCDWCEARGATAAADENEKM